MIHRATWWAGGVCVVIVAGSAVGYWGHQQQQQKSAFARAANTPYQSAYHSLVSDMSSLHSAFGHCLLTQDNQTLDAHLSDISRVAYAGQTELGKLPANFNSDHHLSAYLHDMQNTAREWIQIKNVGTDRSVKKQLRSYYNQSSAVLTQLEGLQTQIEQHPGIWMNHDGNGSSATVQDGLKRVDEAIGTIRAPKPATMSMTTNARPAHQQLKLTKKQVLKKVAALAGETDTSGWTAELHRTGTDAPYYQVSGKMKGKDISGDVSATSGKLLSYYNDRKVNTSAYDFSEASNDATRWLSKRGYASVIRNDAKQFDHVAMFTFYPSVQQKPVMDEQIEVSVGLDNGGIVGYHSTGKAVPRAGQVKKMTMTMAQLRAKLSPDFQVRMENPVIVRNPQGSWITGVAFYGTLHDETHRVILSGQNGSEVSAVRLG